MDNNKVCLCKRGNDKTVEMRKEEINNLFRIYLINNNDENEMLLSQHYNYEECRGRFIKLVKVFEETNTF